jgi:methyl coenzyme M reductase beta subunit
MVQAVYIKGNNMEVDEWLERYSWYLDLSPARRAWVAKLVEEITPEVFVGMKGIQQALKDQDFALLAELIIAYDEVSDDLVEEVSVDDEGYGD